MNAVFSLDINRKADLYNEKRSGSYGNTGKDNQSLLFCFFFRLF